jgi:hypothetical protein
MIKIRHFFFNPYFIFWSYYLLGPIITINHILEISNKESLFKENQISEKFLIHFVAYFSLLPFVLLISDLFKEDIGQKMIPKVQIKTIPGVKQIIIVGLIVFVGLLIGFLLENPLIFIMQDLKRASLYIDFLEKYHIITFLIFIFILGNLFLNNKFLIIFGILVTIFDLIVSRRSLMIFFFYSITKKMTIKLLVLIFLFFSLFMFFRHRELIFADDYNYGNFFDPFFGEAYMVFLSNVQFQECPIIISNAFQYFNFERIFQNYCRTVNNGAGGFSSRFYYNFIFGIISVLTYTIISSSLLLFLHKFLEKSLMPVLKTILFVSLFICFRDSLWNSQIFLIKYFFVLMAFSMIIQIMKKLNIFIEYTKVE